MTAKTEAAVPRPCSEAYRRFVLEFGRTSNFLRDLGNDGLIAKLPAEHHGWLLETAFLRTVDNYLTYLSELLATIFRVRPEVLKSRETVTVEKILEHETMGELISTLADEKVNQLAYKGMRELAKYFMERLGLPIVYEEEHLPQLIRVIATRNLLVHNRGVVNQVYNQTVDADFRRPIGERVPLSLELHLADILLMDLACRTTDCHAIEKFGLPTTTGIGTPALPPAAVLRRQPQSQQ